MRRLAAFAHSSPAGIIGALSVSTGARTGGHRSSASARRCGSGLRLGAMHRRRPPRPRPAAVLGAAAILVLPPRGAAAHGLVGGQALPIPAWLFGWAATVVLVASFVGLAVLWPKPRLEAAPEEGGVSCPAVPGPAREEEQAKSQ